MYIQSFSMEVDWPEIWCLMEVSTMFYICRCCVFTLWGRYAIVWYKKKPTTTKKHNIRLNWKLRIKCLLYKIKISTELCHKNNMLRSQNGSVRCRNISWTTINSALTFLTLLKQAHICSLYFRNYGTSSDGNTVCLCLYKYVIYLYHVCPS